MLVFEDMQWADASLLDFVEYLLDWSREPPDLRGHARAARAARAATELGRRAAELHLALPRAALAAGDGGAPGRARAGASVGAPRPRSSRAPKASRSMRSRPCECCSTGASWYRTAPSTASTGPRSRRSRCRRRCTRSSPPGSTASRPEERRLLQDAAVLGKTFTTRCARGARGFSEAELEPLLSCARAQGGARRAGRPALARARPVRLPPGPRAPRRLRDALEARAQAPAPRGRRVPRARVRGGRGRGGRGRRRRTTSPPTRPRPTRTTPLRSEARRRRCSCAPASAPGRSPRPQRRGATSSRRRSSPRTRRASAALLEQRGRDGHASAAIRTRRAGSSTASIELHRGAGRHACRGPRLCEARGGSTPSRGRRDEALARLERAFAVISRGRARRGSRGSWRRGWSLGYSFAGDLERAAERAELALDIAEAHALPGGARASRCAPRLLVARQPWTLRGGAGTPEARRSRYALEHDLVGRRGRLATSTSRTAASGVTAYGDALELPRRVARPRPPSSGTAPANGQFSAERTYPLVHARPLGRGARSERGVHAGADRVPAALDR